MTHGEKMYSKEHVQAEAKELIEKAGYKDLALPDVPGDLDDTEHTEYLNKVIQKIIAAVHNVKISDDKEAPIISLNFEQIFASIQLLDTTLYWNLLELDPDEDFSEIVKKLAIIDGCKSFISQNQNMAELMGVLGQDLVVNIPLVIPDVNEDEENSDD